MKNHLLYLFRFLALTSAIITSPLIFLNDSEVVKYRGLLGGAGIVGLLREHGGSGVESR